MAEMTVFGSDFSMLTTSLVRDSIRPFTEALPKLVDDMNLENEEVFSVGDFGTLDGKVTLPIIGNIIDEIRESRGRHLPISIMYEDQPNTNYAPLIQTLSGPEWTQWRAKNVYSSLIPVDFLQQCAASDTFNVVFCFWAAHFVSRKPLYRNSIYLRPYGTDEEVEMTRKQAAMDWEIFLQQRSREMKPGAVLMIVYPATIKTEETETVHLKGVWQILADTWRQLLDEDIITKEEYESANYPGYYRNEDEIKKPLKAQHSAVYGSGLRLQSLQLVQYPVVCKPKWIEALKNAGRGKSFRNWIKIWVQTFRSWTYYVFDNALSSRTAESRSDIAKLLYEWIFSQMCRMSEDDLRSTAWDNVAAYITITKL